MKLLFLIIISIIVLALYIYFNGGISSGNEIEFLTNRTDFIHGSQTVSGAKNPETAYFTILAEKFKKKTGITVKLTGYSDYTVAMKRRLASQKYGDVITLPDSNFNPATITTFFKPLGTKKQLSNFYFLNNCAVGDKVYGLSEAYYFSAIVYNKKVFASVGYKTFPKTLEQLHDAFRKIKAEGKIPVILNRGANWPLGRIKIFSDNFDGKASSFNKMWMHNNPFSRDYPIGRAIYETALWVHNGWTEPEFLHNCWDESITQIAEGSAGMIMIGTWALPQVQERTLLIKGAEPDDIGFAPIPQTSPKLGTYILAGAGNPMVISKKTKNFKACKEWIYAIINSGIFANQGGLPINRDNKKINKEFIYIFNEIHTGKLIRLNDPPITEYDGFRTVTLLKDMNVYTNFKYIGNALDKARISMEAYENYVNKLNREFNEAKTNRGYTNNDKM
ncbi:MAG TPA: ABC transporter substrate-binding protein [Victivallales bacterium]|nr:ABC transporter substrate-binding protein [Victivallales bacterium]